MIRGRGYFTGRWSKLGTDAAEMPFSETTERLGVRHLLGTVLDVRVDERGHISGVETAECGILTADLYVDCTGFAGRLIGEALRVPFVDRGDVLFVDRALAIQVPWTEARAPIPSVTIATALSSGWVWDIGLQARRGTGYVYASRYTDDERAERALRRRTRAALTGLKKKGHVIERNKRGEVTCYKIVSSEA